MEISKIPTVHAPNHGAISRHSVSDRAWSPPLCVSGIALPAGKICTAKIRHLKSSSVGKSHLNVVLPDVTTITWGPLFPFRIRF